MVTRAGKDLLKNTIRSTDYHNKLIQEEEMWRQWELEKGLTMMVTDDCIRNRMRMDSYRRSDSNNGKGVDMKKLQKQKEAARESRKGNYWSRKLMEAEENDPDRWGHSGYRELYPEEFKADSPTLKRSSTSQSHSSQERSQSASRHRNHKKHKKKHKRMKRSGRKKKPKRDSDEDESQHSRSNVSSVRNHREDDASRWSECGESPAEEQRHRVNDDEDRKSDLEDLPSLSDVSAAALARRREYLKRKLEEFSQDSASSIEEDERSHPAAAADDDDDPEEDSVMLKRNETYGESRSLGSKRLRSHVTVNNKHLRRT